MTRVRWTADAANDLAKIVAHIREHNPSAAQRVARTIYSAVAELRMFSHRGRVGLAENTRELIFAPWPYIAVYEIIKGQVNVLRIRHASQDWPGEEPESQWLTSGGLFCFVLTDMEINDPSHGSCMKCSWQPNWVKTS